MASVSKVSRNAPCPCGSGKKYKRCCLNIDRGGKKLINGQKITETEAWMNAELAFAGLLTSKVLPIFGPVSPVTGPAKIEALEEIIETCPEYYPALLALGSEYINEGNDEAGALHINKGLEFLKKHFPRDHVIEAYYSIGNFLNDGFRHKMAIEYYIQLVELLENPAEAYNNIALSYACLGDLEKAVENHRVVIKLEPEKALYYSDMGYTLMIKGDLKDARVALDRARELDRDNEYAKNNELVCKAMMENRMGNLEDYLLRAINYDRLDQLEEEDDWEEIDKLTREYNKDRLRGFEYGLGRDSSLSPGRKFDIFCTLNYILDFINEICQDSYFLFDDIATVRFDFKRIMHKFIFKTGDIDKEIFNDTYEALLAFYGYLSEHRVITREGFLGLKKEMVRFKPELLKKMDKYNEIRHDNNLSEDKKEEIRQELFEGDHEWLFL